MKGLTSIVALLSLIIGFQSQANDIQSASQNMCNHVKKCVLSNVEDEENLTPGMRDMMNNMVDNMCVGIMDIGKAMAQDKIEDAAVACLNSIPKLSCQQLDNDLSTPACEKYEALAKKYYPSGR